MADDKPSNPVRIDALEAAIINECTRFMSRPEGRGLTVDELCRGMFHAWERASERFLVRTKT